MGHDAGKSLLASKEILEWCTIKKAILSILCWLILFSTLHQVRANDETILKTVKSYKENLKSKIVKANEDLSQYKYE